MLTFSEQRDLAGQVLKTELGANERQVCQTNVVAIGPRLCIIDTDPVRLEGIFEAAK